MGTGSDLAKMKGQMLLNKLLNKTSNDQSVPKRLSAIELENLRISSSRNVDHSCTDIASTRSIDKPEVDNKTSRITDKKALQEKGKSLLELFAANKRRARELALEKLNAQKLEAKRLRDEAKKLQKSTLNNKVVKGNQRESHSAIGDKQIDSSRHSTNSDSGNTKSKVDIIDEMKRSQILPTVAEHTRLQNSSNSIASTTSTTAVVSNNASTDINTSTVTTSTAEPSSTMTLTPAVPLSDAEQFLLEYRQEIQDFLIYLRPFTKKNSTMPSATIHKALALLVHLENSIVGMDLEETHSELVTKLRIYLKKSIVYKKDKDFKNNVEESFRELLYLLNNN